MSDSSSKGYLLKSLSPNAEATVVCVSAPQLVQELIERQNGFQNPESLVNLAKAALSVLLIQGLNERDLSEKIAMQWQMNGIQENIYADSMQHGLVRATMTRAKHPSNPQSEKQGIFQLRRERGELKASGIINCSGNVNEDVQEYLLQSEQKHCALGLTVNFGVQKNALGEEQLKVLQALGYLVHVLPEENVHKKEELLSKWHQQIVALGGASQWALSDNDQSVCQEMTHLLCFSNQSKKIFDYTLRFECTCSEKKVRRALELSDEILQKQGVSPSTKEASLDITCQYCGKLYTVSTAKA